MENVERIKGKFETPENITTHEFKCGQKDCAVLVHPDLSDVQTVRAVIYAIKRCDRKINTLDDFSEFAVLEYDINISSDVDDCTNKLLNGDVILCIDGDRRYAVINARSYTTRGITEPPT